MKATCNAILLKRINYGESSVIISCVVKESGVKSFIFKGAKKKNSSVLLPLRIVEITYYQREESDLATAYEVHSNLTLTNLYNHPVKTCLLFFMSEFLVQLIHKIQYAESDYYDFLIDELKWLDASDELANYPIYWMIIWIRKLGIQPIQGRGTYFDIEAAQFFVHQPFSHHFYEGETIMSLSEMMTEDKIAILSTKLNKTERSYLLDVLISYFQFHIPEFKMLSSIDVLKTVLGEK